MARFDVIEDGVASGNGNRVGLKGEAVLEGAGAAFECLDDTRRDENGAKGRVTAGNSLPYQNDVWLDVPVLNGERLSGAAHTAHDFVGNEGDASPAADF